MRKNRLILLLCTTIVATLTTGCGKSDTLVVLSQNEPATSAEITQSDNAFKTDAVTETITTDESIFESESQTEEEIVPEIIVIETDFGSYTRLGTNVDYPTYLEDVELNVHGQIYQLSLPKDMGDSFSYDSDTNSLFIYNKDKSKLAFIYLTEFLQTENNKIAYDTETMKNVISFDSFDALTDAEVVTTLDTDSLIVQHIPAALNIITENDYIHNAYTGEVVRYQIYDTDTNIDNACTGTKYTFFYGEDIGSTPKTYIAESFHVLETNQKSDIELQSESDLSTTLITNTLTSINEYVSQTSYLHLLKNATVESNWQTYIDLGLHRTHISEEMTLEQIQTEIKKSHVIVSFYDENNISIAARSSGSGFVVDMDENSMYIATNQHVATAKWRDKYGYYIRFANEFMEMNTVMDNYNIKGYLVGYTYNPDLAIIKCDISNIPYEERVIFKSIPKIKEIALEQNMPVYMYHMTETLNPRLKQGFLYSTELIDGFDGTMSYYTTDISIGGDSGSLFFTQKGQILGVVVGGRVINNTLPYYSVLIPYDLIPTTFEKIVGRPLYENDRPIKEVFLAYMVDYWESIASDTSIPNDDTILEKETIERVYF